MLIRDKSSGVKRRDFAVSERFDVANWGLAEMTSVFAIKLACALVTDFERRTCRIKVTRKHVLSGCVQAKLLLELKRTHRSKVTKTLMQRGSAHACNRRQVFDA